ncbi:hypothetical protein BDD12DRAFT_824566 [Trichophaea hybrida]|nr:hypothetical protein BDD12DRAFT_824566 [Trichophaea hybrida]
MEDIPEIAPIRYQINRERRCEREQLSEQLTTLKSLIRLDADGIGDREDLFDVLEKTRQNIERFSITLRRESLNLDVGCIDSRPFRFAMSGTGGRGGSVDGNEGVRLRSFSGSSSTHSSWRSSSSTISTTATSISPRDSLFSRRFAPSPVFRPHIWAGCVKKSLGLAMRRMVLWKMRLMIPRRPMHPLNGFHYSGVSPAAGGSRGIPFAYVDKDDITCRRTARSAPSTPGSNANAREKFRRLAYYLTIILSYAIIKRKTRGSRPTSTTLFTGATIKSQQLSSYARSNTAKNRKAGARGGGLVWAAVGWLLRWGCSACEGSSPTCAR